MPLKLILCYGLPASGKSTWASTQESDTIKVITKDDLRLLFKESKKREKEVIKHRNELTIQYLSEGKDVIWADTNLNPIHKAKAESFKEQFHGLIVEIKDFTDITLEECIKRDNKRANGVGESVIKDMYDKYLKPKVDKVKHNPDLPNAIIVDIDGTVALMNRSPYDWGKVGEDKSNQIVIDIINSYKKSNPNLTVIFVSGRDEKCKDLTIEWLNKYTTGLFPTKEPYLLMRPQGDIRKDTEIKQEIYENNIKDKFNVKFVLDDRNCVVQMWRSLGLTCLQVAEGNF